MHTDEEIAAREQALAALEIRGRQLLEAVDRVNQLRRMAFDSWDKALSMAPEAKLQWLETRNRHLAEFEDLDAELAEVREMFTAGA